MTVPHLAPPVWGLVFSVGSCVVLWLISLRIRDTGIVAIFWGPGIAGVVDIAAWLGLAGGPRASTALFLVNVWAVRLAAYIFARRDGEDRRYAAMRHHYGSRWAWLSLMQVFLLRAILIWFVPAPLVAAMLASRAPMGWLDYLGIALAGLGLACEAVADNQMARFRLDPANRSRVLDRRLWALSRHPNYTGEIVMWAGFFLIGFSASHAWWLVLSPLAVFLLLQQAAAEMELGMEQHRPGYAVYRARVGVFLPRFTPRG